MQVFLTMGRDGRILIQGRLEQSGGIGHLLHYVAQGEAFLGVNFDDFAKATPGAMELPEQPDMSNIEPEPSPEEVS